MALSWAAVWPDTFPVALVIVSTVASWPKTSWPSDESRRFMSSTSAPLASASR